MDISTPLLKKNSDANYAPNLLLLGMSYIVASLVGKSFILDLEI